jgi:hypothetical protein
MQLAHWLPDPALVISGKSLLCPDQAAAAAAVRLPPLLLLHL